MPHDGHDFPPVEKPVADSESPPHPLSPTRTHDRAMRRASMDAAPYDVSYRPSLLLLYSRPVRRQKWGDTQVLPRVDWGDLFFDLFYVGAFFNISLILTVAPTGRGLLYAMATFFGTMSIWTEKLMYDCRFVYQGDDVYHRLLKVSQLLVLAVAVLNIRPIDVVVGQRRLAVFCLALVLDKVLNLIRYLEVYLFAVGQKRQLQHVAVSASRITCIGLVFYVAATVVAWKAMAEYAGTESHRRLAEAETTITSYSDSYSAMDDLPIILVLCGFLAQHGVQNLQVLFFYPKGGLHKELTVPLNVGFTVHRFGEWVMLLLGESIFSLLIVYVPDQTDSFYATFYCGLLTVILLQYLHFLSLPKDSVNHHALRRSKDAGILWSNQNMIYSFALVALGSTFTNFLLDDTHQEIVDGRFLAESGIVGDPDVIRQQNAHLFAGSLAVIFFCLDTMILAHIGWGASRDRCVCKESQRVNYGGVFLLSLRAALIVFTATLGFWVVDPAKLSIIGLANVLAQLLLRKLGLKYLGRAYDDPDGGSDDESARWPNVTSPQAESHHH